jgi:hypothetical protein
VLGLLENSFREFFAESLRNSSREFRGDGNDDGRDFEHQAGVLDLLENSFWRIPLENSLESYLEGSLRKVFSEVLFQMFFWKFF